MKNIIKAVSIQNCAYQFVNDIISVKNFDLNNIKIDENS